MNKQHKHADVLRAIADGKEAQFKNQILGAWAETNHLNLNPITHPELEWRVKPDPKPDVVPDIKVWPSGNANERIVLHMYNSETHKARGSNLRLTWDGETGRLKKAEVIE